jgi:hypothetical protein
MNLENYARTTPDQALQELYRDMIEAYIVSAPPSYQPALKAMQQRIDAADTLNESEVQAFDVLSKLFHGLKPAIKNSPQDSPT